MNTDHLTADSRKKATRLLVSVRNADEARIVIGNQRVSVIDLKEPHAGSLGCPSFEVASEFVELVQATGSNSRPLTSIALGEVVDSPTWPTIPDGDAKRLLSHFDFAKFGTSELGRHADWGRLWQSAFELVPENVTRVAVAYADWQQAVSPGPHEILEAAKLIAAEVLLVDTFHKDAGSLLDHFSIGEIVRLSQAAADYGVQLALAGSISIETASELFGVSDFLAFRGAVCSGGRQYAIDKEKLMKLTGPLVHR